MGLNAKLVVVGGEVKTTELKLRLPSTIGRARGTSIVLQHPLVSRQHCEIFEADGHLRVRDLGSLNGTFVNNERITSDVLLPPGELLTVGSVTFRAVYEPLASAEKSDGSGTSSAKTKTGTIESLPVGKGSEPVEAAEPVAQEEPEVKEEMTLEASGDYSGLLDSGEIPPLDDGDDELESRPPLFQLASAEPAKPAPAAKPAAVAPPMATPVAAKGAAPIEAKPPAAAPASSKPNFAALANDDTTKSAPAVPKASPPSPWGDVEEPEAKEDEEDDDFNNFLKNLK
ncbi:MAG: FHA domain-containing protein [Planctomycetaceae bacterium]